MPAWNAFADWYTHGSGAAYLVSPEKLLNEAGIRNYKLTRRMLYSSQGKITVKGGSQLKFPLFLNRSNRTETVEPGDPVDINNVQLASTASAPWRMVRGYTTWTDVEIDDETTGITSEKGMFQKFIDIKRLKDQEMATDTLTKLELLLGASFSAANQVNGKDPYSLLYGLTTDGLAPSGVSTVHDINPTTESNYRNQIATYTSATPFDDTDGIIAAFDSMRLLVDFQNPPTMQQYFEDSDLNNQVIGTNREGVTLLTQAARAANSYLRTGAGDFAYTPTFNNRPIENIESFDENSIWSAGSPGYLFIDFKYVKAICKSGYVGQPSKVFDFGEKPDTKVKYSVWRFNTAWLSRKRHGYVSAA